MSKDKSPTLPVPQLRFPEFRDALPWSVERLGPRGDFLSSLTGKTAADFDTGDATFIPYMNVFSNTFTDVEDLRAVDVGEGETQNAVCRGDVFFTVSSETPEDAGMSSVLLSDIANCYLNSFCALFRFHEKRSPDPLFLGYSLRSALVRKHLARGAQGATRYNISKGVFRDVPLLLPDPDEQQKIAECLGSLDDWIAAETDALAALRRHKTGLMQQLFPRPGETRPRLRFPEFQDSGRWEERRIKDIAPLQRGFDLPASQVVEGDVPIVYSNGVRGSHIKGMAEGPGIVTGRSGTLGKLHYIESGLYWPHNTALWVTDFCGNVPRFVFYLFAAIGFSRFASGSGVPTLNRNDAHFFKTFVPDPDEQQRIADCLTSLDKQILEKDNKLTALRDHKHGLMQQLFPAPDTSGRST